MLSLYKDWMLFNGQPPAAELRRSYTEFTQYFREHSAFTCMHKLKMTDHAKLSMCSVFCWYWCMRPASVAIRLSSWTCEVCIQSCFNLMQCWCSLSASCTYTSADNYYNKSNRKHSLSCSWSLVSITAAISDLSAALSSKNWSREMNHC
jgi:hypothetical protein